MPAGTEVVIRVANNGIDFCASLSIFKYYGTLILGISWSISILCFFCVQHCPPSFLSFQARSLVLEGHLSRPWGMGILLQIIHVAGSVLSKPSERSWHRIRLYASRPHFCQAPLTLRSVTTVLNTILSRKLLSNFEMWFISASSFPLLAHKMEELLSASMDTIFIPPTKDYSADSMRQ